VLYDSPQQPSIPEGWIFRGLIALASLMRSVGALIAMITSGILLALPVAKFYMLVPMPRRLGIAMLEAIPHTVMGLLITWLLLRYSQQGGFVDLGLKFERHEWKEGFWGAVAGGATLALVVVPPLAMGWGSFIVAETKIRGVYGAIVLMLLLLVSAFREELIMRGYAFQTLVKPLHMMGAVVITSAAFASIHWWNAGANEYTITNTFLAGCVLAMALVWRRSIWAVTGAHFGWNAASILFGLKLSGTSIPLMPFSLQWGIDPIWTGGDYGPEGGLLCTIVLSLLLLVLIRLYYEGKPQVSK